MVLLARSSRYSITAMIPSILSVPHSECACRDKPDVSGIRVNPEVNDLAGFSLPCGAYLCVVWMRGPRWHS
jgi:hypothetical protein